MKVQLIAALTVATLSSGCVFAPVFYPAPRGVVVVPEEPVEIYEPNVIIVENGIRHDRYFYQRHPDIYRMDMRRYPGRFHRGPYGPTYMPRPEPRFHGPVGPAPRHGDVRYVAPSFQPGRPVQPPQHDDKRSKKKKHHDDDDHRR